MNKDIYDYSELKDDLFYDIEGAQKEGNNSFVEAIGTISYDYIDLANPLYKPDEVMIYTILMLKCIEQDQIIPFVKDEISKIFQYNILPAIKNEMPSNDYNLLETDLNYIKSKIITGNTH